jgi:hypothetical protein
MNQRRSRRKVSGGLFPAGIKTAGGLPAALSGAVRFFVAALLVTTAGLIAGCSSAPPPVNRGLGEVPNAAAVHDDGNTGVYKGVLTSAEDSGRFILDIENRTDGTILMNGSLNDKDFSLAGTERPVAGGFAYDFSGATEDGGVQISFTAEISLTGELDRNGTSFDADGREIMVSMFKETSTELVRIFEGIYAGRSRGTWNFALKGGLITGRYAGDESGGYSGEYDPDTGRVRIWGDDGRVLAAGKIAADSARGTWTYQEDGSYSSTTAPPLYPGPDSSNTWRGKRTL